MIFNKRKNISTVTGNVIHQGPQLAETAEEIRTRYFPVLINTVIKLCFLVGNFRVETLDLFWVYVFYVEKKEEH